MKLLVLFLIGYLFGCVNFSIILTKLLEKKDVRDFGSGNAGFTNTLRNFRLRTAVLVFIGDALKAVCAILLAYLIMPDNKTAVFAASLGTIFGHNFPAIYKFKGGKGVLVSTVAIFFTDFCIGLVIFVGCVLIMFITGYVSLGSVIGAVAFPILTIIFHPAKPSYIVFAVVVGALSVFMHRQNIKRLLAGEENCFRRKNDG